MATGLWQYVRQMSHVNYDDLQLQLILCERKIVSAKYPYYSSNKGYWRTNTLFNGKPLNIVVKST